VLGVHDGALLRELGGRYGMHTLMLEDIQHTDQRPKFQEAEDSFFAVLRMISWRENTGLDVEQVALHATGRTVISFQERPGDVFDGIRERIRTGRGRVRRSTADYLFYAILDAVIDTAFLVVDEIQEQVEDLENRILGAAQEAALSHVHHLRGEVIAVRRALRPLREMLQLASRGDYAYFTEPTHPFLADGYDHILALLDSVDAEMDRVTGLFQLHASMVGASTNEVMRVLTIIATIFIPLTFIAGIYGMNFAVMPELAWRYGYPAILAVMFLVGAGMVVYFRRRKWF
jgi:magnesium transporter